MKTKTIFKTLAMAMMMPAMLLTTACSSDDDAIANNNETPAKKGYPLQVTVNVTRQGDNATTRTTYTDNGDKTGSLSFSSGDQLFVSGEDDTAGQFAGTLTWQSGETFSGTITTENSYSGTANDLFSFASEAYADLLPNGYETYGLYSITENNGYDAEIGYNFDKTFAPTKALAVEQFCMEGAVEYENGGFELRPDNSILNFTISGLTASTEVDVALTSSERNRERNITGKVTTDGSGTATFAVGIWAGTNINIYSLTVDGNTINLPDHLAYPKIYNISRSVGPAYTMASAATSADYGKVVCAAGHLHDAKTAVPSGCTAVAVFGYINGSNRYGIALQDVAELTDWNTITSDGTNNDMLCNVPGTWNVAAPTGASWKVGTKEIYENIFINLGSTKYDSYGHTYDNHVNDYITTNVGGTAISGSYWSTTQTSARKSYLFESGYWNVSLKTASYKVRPVLAF